MSSVKLTRTDLKTVEKTNDKMSNIDNHLVEVRKQSLFQALSTATTTRIKVVERIQMWMDVMEKKIFSPAFIAELDPSKTIALFKYINNLNLKVLVETDRLELVLNNYIQSGAMEMNADLNKGTANKTDIKQLKTDIMEKLSGLLKGNIADAEIVKKGLKTKESDLQHMQNDVKTELTDEERAELNNIVDEDTQKTMNDLDAELDNLDL